MSLRPMPPELPPSRVESDLDTTAELPVLDAATGAPAHIPEEPHGSTGTWIMPSPARNLGVHAPDGGTDLLTLSARLHDAEELLAGKGARLTQLERARDEALRARAAADERIATLAAQLSEHQARNTALAAQLAEQQTRAVSLSAQLAEEQARAAQQATQLTESSRARTAASSAVPTSPRSSVRPARWRAPPARVSRSCRGGSTSISASVASSWHRSCASARHWIRRVAPAPPTSPTSCSANGRAPRTTSSHCTASRRAG